MLKSKATFELIGDFCADIVCRKEAAIKMIISDLKAHFKVCKEAFEPLGSEHFGIIAISYVNDKIAFVTEDGELIYEDSFCANDFDLVLYVWMAFHNE